MTRRRPRMVTRQGLARNPRRREAHGRARARLRLLFLAIPLALLLAAIAASIAQGSVVLAGGESRPSTVAAQEARERLAGERAARKRHQY